MEKIVIFILFSQFFLLPFGSFNSKIQTRHAELDSASHNVKSYIEIASVNPSFAITLFDFTFSDEKKCTDCHSALIEKETKHPAALDDGCTNCHQSNDSIHPKTGSKTFTLSDKMPDLCFNCHDAIKTDITTLKSVHKIINQKKFCVNCHSPHSSSQAKLLINEEKTLCLSCHNKTITTSTRNIENIKLTLSSKNIHPALEGGCNGCHKPHASANNFLLNNAFPEGQYASAKKDSFALCFDCHDSGLLETEKTSSATGFRNGDKNLHFLHINGDKGRSCIMCHNMHASNNEHLILDKVTFGSWSFKLNYKSTETGGSCAPACHGDKTYNRF